jgi:hypothetical protein
MANAQANAQPSAVTSCLSSDCSDEAVFCAEVSARLRGLPSAVMEPACDHDDEGYWHLPACDNVGIDQRLQSVEQQVRNMSGMLLEVLHILKIQQSSGTGSLQSLQSTQSSSVSSVSSIEGSRSPVSFSFVCPLCSGVQHSPKSHCEHLRKVLQAKGECSFVAGNDLHDSILKVWRSPSIFVCWYLNISWQHVWHFLILV